MKVNVVVPARPMLNKSYADRNDARRLVTPVEFDSEAQRVKVRYADGRHATLALDVFHRVFCQPRGK